MTREMAMLRGECHCGALSWTMEGEPGPATACNCTLCRRYGALWAYDYENERIRIDGPWTSYARAGKDNPAGPREWILTGIHSPWGRIATHPAVAAVVFVGSFYVLYLGGLFETVIDYHAAHLLMNLHFLVSGYVFYWLAIGIDPAPRQVSPVAKLGIVWGSLPFHAFFGVALMMTSSVIAEQYYRSLLLPWRYDLYDDQRVGGGIAWAAGEIPLVVIMLALLVQWQRSDERAARRYDRQADRDHDADLEDYNEMLKSLGGRRR